MQSRWLLPLAYLLHFAPASAQRPDVVAALDSLWRAPDTASASRIADRIATLEADTARPVARIAHGLARMRAYELTGDRTLAEDARASFEAVCRADPSNAWAHFGVGLALAHGPGVRETPGIVIGRALAEALGYDDRAKARSAFRQALALDPAHAGAAELLAELALHSRRPDALEEARLALRGSIASGHALATTRLALSYVATALEDVDEAVAAADAVISAGGEAGAEARYALARALFEEQGSRADAAKAWFEGIDMLTPALADRYLDDVRLIASEEEQENWKESDLDGRRAWLRRFWEMRAALAGVDVPARIADHYQRLGEALARFSRRTKYGAPPRNALLLKRPDAPVDDRGLILVRHGEPDRVLRTLNGATLAANVSTESWVYRMPDGGNRMYHFANYAGIGGFSGPAAGEAADGGGGDGFDEWVLVYNLPCTAGYAEDRMVYDPRLKLACRSAFDRRSISAEVRRDAYYGLRTDSDRPDFARALPFAFDFFAFRGADGRTDVTAAMVFPGESLTPESFGTTAFAYALDLTLILADTAVGRVSRAGSTIRQQATRPLARGEWLRTHLTIAAPPTAHAVQRIVAREHADSAHGQLYGGPFQVIDFTGDSLMVSDVVLASTEPGGAFRRGDVALTLMPTAEFPGGAFRAYYEIYGLPPGSTYTTELRIDRVRGGVGRAVRGLFGGSESVRLRFTDEASPDATGAQRDFRRIDSALGPGRYRMTVTIARAHSDEVVRRERDFTVVK